MGVLFSPSGEAALVRETLYGLPGELVNSLLGEAGLEVSLWTHLVKCPGARPRASHVQACSGWLEEEIRAANPPALLCFGKETAEAVIGKGAGTDGELFPARGTLCAGWLAPHSILSGGKRTRASTLAFFRRVKEAIHG